MALFLQLLVVGVATGAIYALIALGYTMVYGIIELINFAHGDIFMVGTLASLSMLNLLGITDASHLAGWILAGVLLLVCLSSILVCAVLGVVIGLVQSLVLYIPDRDLPFGLPGGGTAWSQAIVFAILILILVFRPAGLLGQQTAEKV